MQSVEEVLNTYQDIWVIGGAALYQQFLPYVDEIYLTVVANTFPHADTYFPKLGSEWKVVENKWKLRSKKDEFNHLYLKLKKLN